MPVGQRLTRIRRFFLAGSLIALASWIGIAIAPGGAAAHVSSSALSSSAKKTVVIVGSTVAPLSLDPAVSFDQGAWLIDRAVYQTLLVVPPGGGTPVADASAAAQSCKYTSATSYKCVLKKGLKFSEGTPVTSSDVANSILRVQTIKSPNANGLLFKNLDHISTPNSRTVIFSLKTPDATWPYILSSPAASIVPKRYYPAASGNSSHFIGSGPYAVAKSVPGQEVVLDLNRHWSGPRSKNTLVIVQYFATSSALKLALQQGSIDVAFNALDPADIQSLRRQSRLQVLTGNGSQMDELQFDVGQAPGSNPAVRKAVAYVVDRHALVANVYGSSRQPAYSMVPSGFIGHTNAFATVYGTKPNVALAKKTLSAAGISTPVNLTLWFTPTHYGGATTQEATELQRQLEASGLFHVNLNSTEWVTYITAVEHHQYPVYDFGWYGTYQDPDAFLFWFYSKNALFAGGYANADVQKDIAAEETATSIGARVKALKDLQMIAAQDAPIIPLLQSNTVAVVRKGVTGVKSTLDVTNSLRLWLIGKK